MRDMARVLFALLAGSLVLSSPLAACASAGASPSSTAGVTTATAEKIVLGGRRGIEGPWRSYLRFKLVRGGIPKSFILCAVWDQSSLSPTCRVARGKTLPHGTMMRLEQRRVRSAGWKRVGLSTDAALEAVLSNSVSGNRLGVVSYRVTLRNASGGVLATSNTFRVFWRK